jgi:hypothetical protein
VPAYVDYLTELSNFMFHPCKRRSYEMTIWEHKAANEIAGAVGRHLKKSSKESQQGHQLIGVYKDAKSAASTIRTDPQDLKGIRASLCCACRGDKLYPCDVDEGWSPNCAFIQQSQ